MRMHWQRLLFLFATALALASWASAQGSGQGTSQPPQPSPSSGNSAQAGAGATSSANIYQNGASVPRGLITTTPGTYSVGVIPGIPVPNDPWQLYWEPAEHIFSTKDIARMSRKHNLGDVLPENWKKRVRSVVVRDSKTIPENDDPITLVKWWPGNISYEGDLILARIGVVGDHLYPPELYLGLGLAEAKKLTNTRRVAVRYREHRRNHTSGFSLGSGAGFSRMTQPAADNDGLGAALGGLIGTNNVEVQEYLELEIVCLNDGPLVPPALPPVQQAQAQPAPPPQTFRFEIPPIKVEFGTIKFEPALPPDLPVPETPKHTPPPAPTIAPPAPETCDASGMPELTVLFDFAKPDKESHQVLMESVQPVYIPKIREFLTWLAKHPTCHVQARGFTCRSGSFESNAALGRRRGEALYLQLIANGGSTEQIKEFLSGGMDQPLDPNAPLTSEYEAPNRRANVRIIGKASGK